MATNSSTASVHTAPSIKATVIPRSSKHVSVYMEQSALASVLRQLSLVTEQAQKLTLASRAFHSDKFGIFAEKITKLLGFEAVLPMNASTLIQYTQPGLIP